MRTSLRKNTGFFFLEKRLCRATNTFYPDAHPESTTVDSYVTRNLGTAGEAWATIRAGAGTGADDTNAALQCVIQSDNAASDWSVITRSIFLFDLSSLASVTIHDTTMPTVSLYVTTKNDYFSDSISLVTSTPASNTAVASTDFGNLGTTKQATDKTIASLSTSAYNVFTLNATGKTNVAAAFGSIMKFGVRNTSDNDNAEPTWASEQNSIVNFYAADQSGTTSDPKLIVYSVEDPTVTSSAASSITSVSATLNGNVTDDGGGTISERGFYYGTSTGISVSDTKTVVAGTTGAFSDSIASLSPGVTYYYKAFATNESGTTLSSEQNFLTLSTIPSVTTNSVADIASTSATGRGNVTDDNGATITERGVVVSTSANPTTADTKFVASGTTGSFTVPITGLTVSVQYHVRAFATNSEGTAYGADVTFTTEASQDDIEFNGFSLQDGSSYVVHSMGDWKGPSRDYGATSNPRSDGEKYVGDYWRRKTIVMSGNIVASSESDLETKINAMKKALAVPESNLDIKNSSGVITRYVATLTNADSMFPTREHFHISFIPFSLEFTTLDFGHLLSYDTDTETAQTGVDNDVTVNNAGTIEAQPIITVDWNYVSNAVISQTTGTNNRGIFSGNPQGQTFTPTANKIHKISVRSGTVVGTPTGDVTCKLWLWDTDYATTTGGTPIATVTNSTFPQSSYNDFIFDPSVSITSGQMYFFEFEMAGGDSGNCYRILEQGTDVLAGGALWVVGVEQATRDMRFTLYEDQTNTSVVTITNETNSQAMTITRAFNGGEQLVIHGENKTVTVDGVAVDYSGVFPEVETGDNTFNILITGATVNYDVEIKHLTSFL